MPAFALALWPLLRSFLGLFAPALDPRVWPALALIAATMFGCGWYKGDKHGDRQCEVRIQRDRDEQNKIIKEAGETTFTAIDRWLTETEKTNELEIQLAIEASKDPTAKRACFGLDGMRRINRLSRKSRG